MDILNIDIKSHVPDIIDAYTEVFGEEYRYIIQEKLKNIYYITYNNARGLDGYAYFLEKSKRCELNIKFLKQIGVDVSKYKKQDFINGIDDELNRIITIYIDGIKAFDTDIDMAKIDFTNKQDMRLVLRLSIQLDLLNILKNPSTEEITQNNYIKFYQSEEYKQLKVKIDEYIEKYKQVEAEYREFLKQTEKYRKYVENENEREEKIERAKSFELFREIQELLPKDVLQILNQKYNAETEKMKALFDNGIDFKADIEYYSEEDEEKLLDESTSEEQKNKIYYYRLRYLKNMGMDIKNLSRMNTGYDQYKKYTETENARKLIPTPKAASDIQKCRENKYEECRRKYIYTKPEYKQAAANLGRKEFVYKEIEKNTVGATLGINVFGVCKPILFFTVRKNEEGMLDFILLHEFCHMIEYTSKGSKICCGFEIVGGDKIESNPYDNKNRKYERMNETITDMFAMEAREILQSKGIYMLEDKEHTRGIVDDKNTSSITKIIVKPLLSRYRKQVIDARIWGDFQGLYDAIGEKNFEELNDVVNNVDYLISQGLVQKINTNQHDDELVLNFKSEVSRIEEIYNNIQMHCMENNIDYEER